MDKNLAELQSDGQEVSRTRKVGQFLKSLATEPRRQIAAGLSVAALVGFPSHHYRTSQELIDQATAGSRVAASESSSAAVAYIGQKVLNDPRMELTDDGASRIENVCGTSTKPGSAVVGVVGYEKKHVEEDSNGAPKQVSDGYEISLVYVVRSNGVSTDNSWEFQTIHLAPTGIFGQAKGESTRAVWASYKGKTRDTYSTSRADLQSPDTFSDVQHHMSAEQSEVVIRDALKAVDEIIDGTCGKPIPAAPLLPE